jgi:hypothetical protein
MQLRASKPGPASPDVQQAGDPADDLVSALEALRESISRASTAAGRLSADLGLQASRRSAELGREASRRSAEAGRRGAKVARETAERLAEPDQVADLTRRAVEKLFPELVRQRERTRRRRRLGLVAGAGGLLGLGLLIGWLTAPRRGAEARQAVKEQATRATRAGAGEQGSEPAGPAPVADVTPLHQGNGAGAGGNPTRLPPG